MSFLTGSAPKASFSTQPTILPQQQSILDTLASILNATPGQQGGFNLGTQGFGNLNALLQGAPTGTLPAQDTTFNTAFSQLLASLGYQAPNVTAPQATSPGAFTPQTVGVNPISAGQIDPTAAFRTGVVQPLTEDFLSKTLPAIAGKAGGSAGGAYGSGAAAERQTAATNLEKTLAQTGSQYALGAQQANQDANLRAALANLTAGLSAQQSNQSAGLQAGLAGKSADLSTILANLQSSLTTGLANQGASTQSNQQRLAALGLAPSVSTLPETTTGAKVGISTAGLAPFFQMLASMIGATSGGTQQTVGVGTGGSTGLLGGLMGGLGSFAGSPAGSAAIASLFSSDRRLKDDIEEIGTVDGLPLYRFRYKGEPARYIGFMADEVERRDKSAVVTMPSGYKAVNYGKVIADMLEAA